MTHSLLEIKPVKKIDEGTSFTDIFCGILLERKKQDERSTIGFSHAKLFPYASNFFKERTSERTSPVRVLETALMGEGSFIPGGSFISIPWWDFLGIRWRDMPETKNGRFTGLAISGEPIRYTTPEELSGQERLMHRLEGESLKITDGETETHISAENYERAFAQVLTGALDASVELGKEDVLRVPSFLRRAPNYLGKINLNYVGEGLERGTLFVEGSVGDLCGKHANGGNIVVTGTTEDFLGDCATGVNFYVGGESEENIGREVIGSITQARRCNFYIKSAFYGEISADECSVGLESYFALRDKGYICSTREDVERAKEELKKKGTIVTEFDETVEKRYDEFVSSLKFASV